MTHSRRDEWSPCYVSVIRIHCEGGRRDGRCTWCGVRFADPPPKPDPWYSDLHDYDYSDLGIAYRYHYDPDWGIDPHDF